jgi:cysteine synthase
MTALGAPELLTRFGIGHTPLVLLPDVAPAGQIWLKAEYCNPFGSVKDRTAAYLLDWAHQLAGGQVHVVESTSGNLGLALAQIGAQLGMRVTLVMDASLPKERVAEVRRTGAEVRVVSQCLAGATFRESRIALARELGSQPGWLWLDQYGNAAGMQAHQETTGPEIWDELDGAVDVIVASAGTGGTICGIGAAMRDRTGRPLIVGVEPVGSTISGGSVGDYLPAGSGMRGAPDIIDQHRELVDYFAKVPDCVAAAWALLLHDRFGLDVGQTTGAAVAVAVVLAGRCGCRAAVIAPDHGQAFLPSMRGLAASRSAEMDADQIELTPFGSTERRPDLLSPLVRL